MSLLVFPQTSIILLPVDNIYIYFFLEKDNIGLLCITNIVIGIISGLGMMFLCNNRKKAENYERFVKMKL